MPSYIGQVIKNRYNILSLIDVGNTTDVYKAMDIKTGRVVAIKFVKDEFLRDYGLSRRIEEKYRSMKNLKNKYIAEIYDVVFSYDMKYVVMEFVEGMTLREYLDHWNKKYVNQSVHYIIQLLTALEAAHKKGVTHYNLKPSNIMVDNSGSLKILNFGTKNPVSTSPFPDSVYYNSPEQHKKVAVDHRSDLYSTGIILYELLTGKTPFFGKTADIVAKKHIEEDFIPPKSIESTIPTALEQIIMHALEKSPSKRYQSASEMLSDLQTFRNNPNVKFSYKTINRDGGKADSESSDTADDRSAAKKSAGFATGKSVKQEDYYNRLERDNEKLTAENEEQKSRLAEITSELDEQKQKNEELEAALEKNKSKNQNLYSLIETQKNQIFQAESALLQVQSQCDMLIGLNNENKEKIKELEQKLEAAEAERAEYSEKISVLDREYSELSDNCTEIQSDYLKLEEKLKAAEQQAEDYKTRFSQAIAQNEILYKENKRYKKAIKSGMKTHVCSFYPLTDEDKNKITEKLSV